MNTVIYIQTKDIQKAANLICKFLEMNQDVKYYIQIVPEDAMMLSISAIDEWAMKSIKIWQEEGHDVVIQTGKPTPPPCPPGQNCQ
jgi:hypothetical protein